MKTDPILLENSRSLRKNMTPEEKKLWYTFLRSYPTSFRKQFVKDGYILDFYCPQVLLAIEIDGGQHYSDEGIEYDRNRETVLSAYGIKILRFTNADITKRFRAVCEMIDDTVKGRI